MKHETAFDPTSDNVTVPRATLLLATKCLDHAVGLAAEHTHLISLAMMEGHAIASTSDTVRQLLDNKTNRLQSLGEYFDDAKEAGQDLQNMLDADLLVRIEAKKKADRLRTEKQAAANVKLAEELTDLAKDATILRPDAPSHMALFLTSYRRSKEIVNTPGFFPPLGAALAMSAKRVAFMRHIQTQYDEAAKEADSIRCCLRPGEHAVGEAAERLAHLRQRADDLAAEMNALDGAMKATASTTTH